MGARRWDVPVRGAGHGRRRLQLPADTHLLLPGDASQRLDLPALRSRGPAGGPERDTAGGRQRELHPLHLGWGHTGGHGQPRRHLEGEALPRRPLPHLQARRLPPQRDFLRQHLATGLRQGCGGGERAAPPPERQPPPEPPDLHYPPGAQRLRFPLCLAGHPHLLVRDLPQGRGRGAGELASGGGEGPGGGGALLRRALHGQARLLQLRPL